MKFLTDWLAGEKRGADYLMGRPPLCMPEEEEPVWREKMDLDTKKGDRLEIETGISGNMITLRITGETGLITTLKMDTDLARTIGQNIIGQANLISPPDGPEPGAPNGDPDCDGYD
jgi:hypothetical protein